jgi:hypothetical protein
MVYKQLRKVIRNEIMFDMKKEDTVDLTNVDALLERIEKAQPLLVKRLGAARYAVEMNSDGWCSVEDLRSKDTSEYFRSLGNLIPKYLGDDNDRYRFILHDGTETTCEGALLPHEILSNFLRISLSGDEKDIGDEIHRHGNVTLNGETVEIKLVEYKAPKLAAFNEYLEVEDNNPCVAGVRFMEKGFDIVITDYPGMVKRDEAIETMPSVRGLIHALVGTYAKLKIYSVAKEYMHSSGAKVERKGLNTLMNALMFAEYGYGIDLNLPSCSTNEFTSTELTVVNE